MTIEELAAEVRALRGEIERWKVTFADAAQQGGFVTQRQLKAAIRQQQGAQQHR